MSSVVGALWEIGNVDRRVTPPVPWGKAYIGDSSLSTWNLFYSLHWFIGPNIVRTVTEEEVYTEYRRYPAIGCEDHID